MGIATLTVNAYQKCIDECSRCAQACFECFESCINEPDLNSRRSCIKMLIECGKMCEMSIGMMSMNGNFAKECGMFKDDHCQKCAQECRTCADECRRMSGM